MCGIAGQFETRLLRAPDHAVLNRMALAIQHRGPDDQGMACGDHWGLVSRRLAIIGVETGHQPLSNEDGTVWVAFNGEIYNHKELRARLRRTHHVFASTTDTEVLVHLYEEYGDSLVEHLVGMFAFALVDVSKRRLLLGRDRLGQKPLVYNVTPEGTVIFASELGALQHAAGCGRDLDAQALSDYLALGYIPAPGTIYTGVKKLTPGSLLTVSCQQPEPRIVRYWHPRFEPKEHLSLKDAAAQTRHLLEQAVARRLESEVPLGAFLSGGIDSTAVVALMQQQVDTPVKTFTIGFPQERYDERRYAELAARELGTHHAADVAEPRDAEMLQRIICHCGEPYCDASILPTALLSRFTRGSVTVALSGDGGDELFGGYERYRVMALHRLLSGIPLPVRHGLSTGALTLFPRNRGQRTALATLRRLLTAFGQEALEAYSGFQGIFSAAARETLLTGAGGATPCLERTDVWRDIVNGGTAVDLIERFLELDMLEYLPGDVLFKVDIASMMFSLEVRSPFLDHDLVEAVCRLPRTHKVGLFHRKKLLSAAMGDCIPRCIAARPKRGFGVPLAEWLRTDLADSVREMVLWQREWDPDGLFDQVALRTLAEEHLNSQADHSARLWAMLCYRLWRIEVYKKLP